MNYESAEHRYQEHGQLQIPKALPPVAEALSATSEGASAKTPSGPAVSDKEWKTLLGKLVRIPNPKSCVLHTSTSQTYFVA